MSKPRKQKPSAWTEFCRLILCGLGGFFIAIGLAGYFDEQQHRPLWLVIFFVVFGLLLVGIGAFAKPKSAQGIAESLNVGDFQ